MLTPFCSFCLWLFGIHWPPTFSISHFCSLGIHFYVVVPHSWNLHSYYCSSDHFLCFYILFFSDVLLHLFWVMPFILMQDRYIVCYSVHLHSHSSTFVYSHFLHSMFYYNFYSMPGLLLDCSDGHIDVVRFWLRLTTTTRYTAGFSGAFAFRHQFSVDLTHLLIRRRRYSWWLKFSTIDLLFLSRLHFVRVHWPFFLHWCVYRHYHSIQCSPFYILIGVVLLFHSMTVFGISVRTMGPVLFVRFTILFSTISDIGIWFLIPTLFRPPLHRAAILKDLWRLLPTVHSPPALSAPPEQCRLRATSTLPHFRWWPAELHASPAVFFRHMPVTRRLLRRVPARLPRGTPPAGNNAYAIHGIVTAATLLACADFVYGRCFVRV